MSELQQNKIKINENRQRIDFNEETHTYTYLENNEILPSVTQITGILSNKVYNGIDEETLKKAAEKGSLVHKAIEDFTLWEDYQLPEEFENYMLNFKKALALEKFEPKYAEFKLTNGIFCGTIDNMSLLNNQIIIIDYKTTSTIHKKLLEAQFGGYKLLCDYNGIKVDKWYGLFLSKTGYKFIEIKPDIDIFKKCLDIYNFIKEEE